MAVEREKFSYRSTAGGGEFVGVWGGGIIVDVKGKIMVVVRDSVSIILQHTVGSLWVYGGGHYSRRKGQNNGCSEKEFFYHSAAHGGDSLWLSGEK